MKGVKLLSKSPALLGLNNLENKVHFFYFVASAAP